MDCGACGVLTALSVAYHHVLLLLLLHREILLGKSLRLKHGWVAVVNRGQADINKRMTMVDARAKELGFFKEADAYRWGQDVGGRMCVWRRRRRAGEGGDGSVGSEFCGRLFLGDGNSGFSLHQLHGRWLCAVQKLKGAGLFQGGGRVQVGWVGGCMCVCGGGGGVAWRGEGGGRGAQMASCLVGEFRGRVVGTCFQGDDKRGVGSCISCTAAGREQYRKCLARQCRSGM